MEVKMSRLLSFPILFCIIVNCNCQVENYNFIIFNDVRGQLQDYIKGTEHQIKPTVPCWRDDCRGGFRKVAQQLENLRNSNDRWTTFFLTPGNLVGGESGWLSVLGWKEYGSLVSNFYKPTVTSLGMYDFVAGLEETIEYFYDWTIPVVLSNLNCTFNSTANLEFKFCRYPLLFTDKVYPLTETIGVVGFVNPEVMRLSSPGNLKFKEIIPALKQVIDSSVKYKTYIALGDGSRELAKDILAQIPEIQLVIYGQGFDKSKYVAGNFPETTENGFIATGGNYGSSIGNIKLGINSTGSIVDVSGSELIATDLGANSQTILSTYAYLDAKVYSSTISKGTAHVDLNGNMTCWTEECVIGNLISDALVQCVLNTSTSNFRLPSQEPLFAIWHSNARFLDSLDADSVITTMNIHKWLPYKNKLYLVSILGSNLLEAFNKSATGITEDVNGPKNWGQFLQVSSGIRVEYITSSSSVDIQIQLLHKNNTGKGFSVLAMQEIDLDLEYYFVIPSFIYQGRNVYEFLKSSWRWVQPLDLDDTTCLTNYVEAMKRISVSSGERIRIGKVDGIVTPTTTTPKSSSSTPTPMPLSTTTFSIKPVTGSGEVLLVGTVTINLPVAAVGFIIASQRFSMLNSM